MSNRYTPVVGGWKWGQALVDLRRRTRDVARLLRQLENVATTDRTRLVIVQAQLACAENLADLERLLAIGRVADEADPE